MVSPDCFDPEVKKKSKREKKSNSGWMREKFVNTFINKIKEDRAWSALLTWYAKIKNTCILAVLIEFYLALEKKRSVNYYLIL